MMRCSKLLFVLCNLLVVLAAPAAAKGADDASLAHERHTIDKRLAAEEVACYQKFAVNGCLRSARQQARSERAAVQQRDNALKDAARRERSAAHRQELQDKQAVTAEKVPPEDGAPSPAGPRVHRSAPPAQRAHRSAGKQSASAESPDQERARRAQDAARARQRLLDKQSAAAERAQAQQRRQAQREASGHPQAAPLSDPP